MFIQLASFLFLIPAIHALRQLSFSGGGAFGAVEIGILKYLVEKEPALKYDLYTGVSAGALNAGFLSYFSDTNAAVKRGESIYKSLKNQEIYSLYPFTGKSVYNTQPLNRTLASVLTNMHGNPVIDTYIGTVCLNDGLFYIYPFHETQSIEEKVALLMSSSAIPTLFPPILRADNKLYVDGGTLSNELFDIEHDGSYINITYITPTNELKHAETEELDNLENITKRVIEIVLSEFNNPITFYNEDCHDGTPIGEINAYFVPSNMIANYSMLDFDHGEELLDIGYQHVQTMKYHIC